MGHLVAGEETTAFRQGVEKLLLERRTVVINLTEVDHIDSTGLGRPRTSLDAEERPGKRGQAGLFEKAFDGVAQTHKAGHGHYGICERRGGGCVIPEAAIILTRLPELTSTGHLVPVTVPTAHCPFQNPC
jgi:hypothetical protein